MKQQWVCAKTDTIQAYCQATIAQQDDFAFFCRAIDQVCFTRPRVRGIKADVGLERMYWELGKHSFSKVLRAHITRGVRDHRGHVVRMTWELCTLLMMEHKILCVNAAMALLNTLMYMWEAFGVSVVEEDNCAVRGG